MKLICASLNFKLRIVKEPLWRSNSVWVYECRNRLVFSLRRRRANTRGRLKSTRDCLSLRPTAYRCGMSGM